MAQDEFGTSPMNARWAVIVGAVVAGVVVLAAALLLILRPDRAPAPAPTTVECEYALPGTGAAPTAAGSSACSTSPALPTASS